VHHCSFWICSSNGIEGIENCEIVHSDRFAERCSFYSPLWWTPTAKAIAVAGIVLGMKFLHSFGLIHCGLKPSNIFLMNLIELKLQILGEADLIRVEMPQLCPELRQSLQRLRCDPVKSGLRRSMYSRLH
jgi:hypothetical protein